MAFIKLVGLLLSLLFVFHDSSAHVDLGRKLKGDMKMATREKYTQKGIVAQDSFSGGVVEKEGEEARKMVNKNKLESSKKKSGAAHIARKCSSTHQGKDHVKSSCSSSMLILHKSSRIIVMRRFKVAASSSSSLAFTADYSRTPKHHPPKNN